MPKARTPLDYDRYQELHAQGLSLRQIAKELGIPESTLRDNLKMMQKAQASHGLPHLLTLSTGEKIAHPHELRQTAHHLAQAQRGGRTRLAARLQERLANQRKDRNHKLSRRLVAENHHLVWSKDRQTAIADLGKSVASAGHAQLRGMLAYKCTASGRQFLEVPSKFSTKTCAACGSLSGPTGYAGLSVRQWTCAVCGTAHDRDVNAAINTLHAGVGTTHERHRKVAPGIPGL